MNQLEQLRQETEDGLEIISARPSSWWDEEGEPPEEYEVIAHSDFGFHLVLYSNSEINQGYATPCDWHIRDEHHNVDPCTIFHALQGKPSFAKLMEWLYSNPDHLRREADRVEARQ